MDPDPGGQKNTWIRWIWIRNTVPDAVQLGEHGVHHAQGVARLSTRVFTRCRQALNLAEKGNSVTTSTAVLGIRDILVRIRIPGSVPLTNGSRSGSNCASDSFLQ